MPFKGSEKEFYKNLASRAAAGQINQSYRAASKLNNKQIRYK